MTQPIETCSGFPELDNFLDCLHSRWSPEACAALCSLKPGTNDSAARAVFDRELTALCEIGRAVQHALLDLSASVGSQRNRYSKINDLPAEILREIFLSACEYGLRWKDLASIIRTCKPWYNILALDPAAYTTINWGDHSYSHHLAEIFARRSIPLPLNIAWDDTGSGTSLPDWEDAFCSQYIHRVKTLQYAILKADEEQWLHELSAPQLEQCTLFRFEFEELQDDEDDAEFDPRDHVLPCLFSGDTPKLRVLDLDEVRLAWFPGNYNDLTHLTITFHPGILMPTELDTDNITLIFRSSSRLEHVELTANGLEYCVESMVGKIPDQHHLQSRTTMYHLQTLRIHLPVLYTIFVLKAIELTPTIRTVDLLSDSGGHTDRRFLDALDTGILPDFLFTHLRSLSLRRRCLEFARYYRSMMEGSGILDNHGYSFHVCHPFADVALLADNIISKPPMLELRRIDLFFRLTSFLVPLLAISPAVDEVNLVDHEDYVPNSLDELQNSLSNQPNPLTRVSHWAFSRDQDCDQDPRPRLTQRDVNALMAFFQHSSPKRRAISVDGAIYLHAKDGLRAMRNFVVDLAQLNVAVRGPVKFYIGWHHDRDDWSVFDSTTPDSTSPYSYVSAEALWPNGEVPEVVQGVMRQGDT